jgi:hypothetical protein
MASVVQICNRALQKLGSKRITDIEEDSVEARSCNVLYEDLRDAELRAHPWNFAIARSEIAADSETPDWGRANSFTLPADFLFLLEDYPEDNSLIKDWQIEGRKILTDDDAPIQIRYIKIVTDPNEMDPLFREALATKMAIELCEELTQSNTKKEGLKDDYKEIISQARKRNAIENVAAEPPTDIWLTARS